MDKAMRKWTGEMGIASLPFKIEEALRQRSRNVLERHRVSDEVIGKIVNDLVHQVSWAYAEREYKLDAGGPGRPASGPSNLLTVNVADLLREHGLRGNWLKLGDNEEYGVIGPVAELEAIAQAAFREACDEQAGAAFREACGEQAGVMARPARITNARKMLGKVHRNK